MKASGRQGWWSAYGDRGQVVVITGASAGVGRATARAFADRGARVGLIARGAERLRAAAREVEERGGAALVLPLDVGDAERVEEAAARIEDTFGPIDVWINNAMTTVFAPVRDMTADEFRRVTEVTYLGYVHGTLAALRRMLPRDRGTIVQVGSALAYRAIPLQSAYCAAKHAIEGFTESLRTELMHDGSGVKVTSVHLPAVNTPQFEWVKSKMPCRAQPVPPIYEPEVAARAIAWAAHHPDRRDLKVGWPTLRAIFGTRIAPAVADRVLARSGVEAQQTDEPEDPTRPHNLWRPVPGDFAARGRFSDQAARTSPLTWASMHRGAVAVAVGGAAAVLVAVAGRRLLGAPLDG
ncbi:MAG: SDR family oxidoreductase [Planctomycetes bacterium]|nr:SDR family oxidoreductase [Planctomycetota bacterium]